MIHKVTNMFVGNGTALETSVSTLTPGKLGLFGNDNTVLAALETISTLGKDSIFFSETYADGSNKKSMRIRGTSVIGAKSEDYAPAAREVWALGYNRKTATGAIEVNPSADYTFSILFKNDKTFYSVRPEAFRQTITSSASATQLTIATQVAAAINNGAFKSQIVAVVVANGTGVYGLTGATNYGVEITAKDINQFTSSTYRENRVYFSVHVDDSTGFGGTTTCTQISANSQGEGTYKWVYNYEKYLYQYEGLQNLRMWPAQTQSLNASSTGALSAAIVPTVSGTISEDVVTFSASVAAILRVGELVELGGVMYEIKYFVSSTVAVLTTVLSAGLVAAAAKLKMFYDIITIEFNDTSFTTGPDTVSLARKAIYICTPAINATQAYTADSTEKAALIASLNPWLASTPVAPAALA